MTGAAGPGPAGRTLPAVTVVGLGPAGPEFLTAAATAALAAIPVWYVRTARHPAAEPLVAAGAIALDHHYETAATFAETYAGIVEEVVAAATAHGRVGYAVPGSPWVLEATVRALLADERVAVEVVEGMSFLDLAWRRLGIDPVESRVRLVDGERFGNRRRPGHRAAAGRPRLVAVDPCLDQARAVLDAGEGRRPPAARLP